MRVYGSAVCEDCNKLFTKGSGNSIRCKPCAMKKQGTTGVGYVEKACAECGAQFKPNSGTQSVCLGCRDVVRRARNRASLQALRVARGVTARGTIKQCVDCGSAFAYQNGVQVRCPPCTKAKRIQQRREWEKRNPLSFQQMERNRMAHAKWYNNKFDGNRKKALDRDQRTCQRCGHHPAGVVHHMDGFGENYETPNHALENLVTMCRRCHSAIHASLERALFLRHPDTVAEVHAEFFTQLGLPTPTPHPR